MIKGRDLKSSLREVSRECEHEETFFVDMIWTIDRSFSEASLYE